MELSRRLQAVADLISEGRIVADVGTDHGYIPIYLIEAKKCIRAIAMDVNQGPLLRAKEHIAEHGLSQCIETRLSNGVQNLQPEECDCVVIAGMGGALTIKILEEGKQVFKNLKEFILQPQSELLKVRQYLLEQGYCISQEEMVQDAGKFYTMMRVLNGPMHEYDTVELRYGKLLLEHRHPVLKMFLEKEAHTKQQILKNIILEKGLHIEARKQEIEKELEGIEYALQRYYTGD